MDAPATPAPPPGRRLAGLDGLRGLAALYVVVYHVSLRAFPGYPYEGAPFWAGWFVYGRFAVLVFIVLSGFSLALSPARAGWRLDGIAAYARRRARRILPAFWAALAFSLLVAWLIVPQPRSGVPDAMSVLVNGLLVQNIVGAPSPNTAFWSIAVEVQLYVLLPVLLLLTRKRGALAMVAGVTLVVAAVGIVGPHVARLDTFVTESAPDLAALFALGIASAGVVVAGTRKAWPWPWLALAAGAPVLAMIACQGSAWTFGRLYWIDLAIAPAIACLLIGLASGRPASLVRLLDARPIRGLGSSSYSLYLTHAPIIAIVYGLIVSHWFHPGTVDFLVSLAIVLPLTIAFAKAFASVFERGLQPRRPAAAVGRGLPREAVPG
jgi:peptidoglycan/LPS O-acetylase OafA/YrhL